MDRYSHDQNPALYRKVLAETTDPTKRQAVLKLLADEQPTSAHRQRRSERSTSIGGCHDDELWINFACVRRDFRALLRCDLGVLVCGTVARSKCPASVNQFCPVCLRWLDAEVETAADPAIRDFHFSQHSRRRCGLYGLRPAPGSRWESTHVPSSELVKRPDGKPV
jgi:hypothetical protein